MAAPRQPASRGLATPPFWRCTRSEKQPRTPSPGGGLRVLTVWGEPPTKPRNFFGGLAVWRFCPRSMIRSPATWRRSVRSSTTSYFPQLPFINESLSRTRVSIEANYFGRVPPLAGRPAGRPRTSICGPGGGRDGPHGPRWYTTTYWTTPISAGAADDQSPGRQRERAVLLGDYLISHAFHLCSSLESQYASSVIAATTNTVCEGELQQAPVSEAVLRVMICR